MNLSERLQCLVGHDFIVHMANDPFDEDDDPVSCVPMGRLQDVGDGYAVIETKSEEDGGFVNMGGEWVISLRYVTIMLHTLGDCAGCAVDAAGSKTKSIK